ncbi:aspartokinase [Clostridiales bacterium]|nr:aspartokinase [Clostridiales bacterium]
MLIVQKYGGSSLANKNRMIKAAERIADTYRQGSDVIVVVSAQGNTTDELIKSAEEINPSPSGRELDMVLSVGEQISAALMSMALEGMGIPAVSLIGWQMGIVTTDNYGNAGIEKIYYERIKKEISEGRVVVAAGFQGINCNGDITTLGRGGSDTTAVALAAALNADKCEIYTDVEGVFTADPRTVPEALKLDRIGYGEMLDYTTMGAKVLHNRSVELAKRFGIPLVVRSSFTENEGTMVCEEGEIRTVSGIASDSRISLITITGDVNENNEAYNLLSTLARRGISADMLICHKGEIAFTISEYDARTAMTLLKTNRYRITINTNISKVSIVGIGLETNNKVMTGIYEALLDEGVKAEAIMASETKISILVDKEDSYKAVQALHKKFFGDGRTM